MKADIEHLVTFVHVIQQGSFSKAADEMEISKSVVSKHISALEHRLKTQLMIRSTRSLQITEAGKRLYEHVQHIPEQILNAEQLLATMASKPYGNLRVVAPMNMAASLKDIAIPQFMQQYPEIILDMQFLPPVADFLQNEFDIVILWKLEGQNFPDYDLVGTKLFAMNVDIYATPSYLAQKGIPKTPEDLQAHNGFSSIGRIWPLKINNEVKQVKVNSHLNTNDDEVIKAATLANLGIAYSYPYVYQHELENGQVVPILRDYTDIKVEVYAFHHPTQYIQPKISSFIQFIKNYYTSIQDEIAERGRQFSFNL